MAPEHLYAFILLALAFNGFGYFISDRLVLRMHGAREISPDEGPQLHALVQELADRAAIPKPRVDLIPADYANAFATGRNPRHGVVAVSAGLLHLLSKTNCGALLRTKWRTSRIATSSLRRSRRSWQE